LAVKGKAADKPTKKSKEAPPRLPTMEDSAIHELNQAALDYDEGRDERMEMTKREVELKTKLIALMHRHNRKTYVYEDIEIELIPEGEKVKVRVRKEKEED
jgi:hypothetical protein